MLRKAAIAALASVAAGKILRSRTPRTRVVAAPKRSEDQLHNYVLWVALPLWIAAGLLDYIWHRRTRIETTAGPKESVLHLMMLTEAAPIALAPLLFEMNAGVLMLLLTCFATHEATAAYDVSMAAPKRVLEPFEQHVHSVLEMMPFCVTSIYTAANWDRLRSMLRNPRQSDFSFRLKEDRPSIGTVAALVSAITAFDFVPHLEELWRCLEAQQRGLAGRDTPECATVLYGHADTAEPAVVAR